MDLNTLWFVLIALLFTGYFFLEGFDYGVGMLLPLLGKNEKERRTILNTIGPFWDGNEVWLVTAGGAMFAAFPHWYATLFSGSYLTRVLILMALIFRGVTFQFRRQLPSPAWRTFWDWAICAGSLIPAFLWGVTVGNLVQGMPIDATMSYVGSPWSGITWPILLSGATLVALFTLHGALFLALKTYGLLIQRALAAAERLWPPTFILTAAFLAQSASTFHFKPITTLAAIVAIVALLLVRRFIATREMGRGFVATGLTIIGATAMVFTGLYPNVMPSTLNPSWSLTIYNAASGPYTLRLMSIVALTLLPLILTYQGWSYYVLRHRLRVE